MTLDTYTLAVGISDDVVLACIPDGGDIAGALREPMKQYDEIGIVIGVILATEDQVQDGDKCIHSFHAVEFSPLRDVEGARYRYAVERKGFPIVQRVLKRTAA